MPRIKLRVLGKHFITKLHLQSPERECTCVYMCMWVWVCVWKDRLGWNSLDSPG